VLLCFSLPLLAATNASTCFASCSGTCCFTQFNTTSKQCITCDDACQTTTSATSYRIFYKDRYNSNTPGNGARVCIAFANNGWWNKCNLGPSLVNAYTSSGVLSEDAKSPVTIITALTWHKVSKYQDCQNRCGQSSLCWGFVYQEVPGGENRCLYRGGCSAEVPGGPIPSVFNTYVA
jgi:hypothetical protein